MSSSTLSTPPQRFSLAEQARAFGLVLKKEFGVPFAFYDAAGGGLVQESDAEGTPAARSLEPAAAVRLALAEEADARLQPDGRFQLILVMHEHGAPVLVATGALAALTKTLPDMASEQARLRGWAQAVSDRLRLADKLVSRHRVEATPEPQTKTAWEALLRIDHVARRVRVHRDVARSRKRTLQAAWEVLGVQTLVWVPQAADEAVVLLGEACVSDWEARQLASRVAQAPDLQSSRLLLCNDVPRSGWGGRFPWLLNLLAMPVSDQAPFGWVLALNKPESRCPAGTPAGVAPFRRSDAALLTPFVALLDMQLRGSARYRDLQDLLVGLAQSLTAAIDAKDSYTYGHSERVARIAVELGRTMRLQEEEISDLFLAGLLHDIGKIGVRDSVLGKQGSLTPEEFQHVKQHVLIGYSILENLRPIMHLLPGVRNHHERYDGKGYPDGLAGETIPLMARILAVADAYDAMTTSRPYRDALSVPQVEQILCDGADSQWDRRVVESFMACRQKIHGIRQRGVGDSLRTCLQDVMRNKGSTLLRSVASLPTMGTPGASP
jgi:HD-GYP domain-containing protein (c-di-GMP phosphodiesterase class II)